MTNCTTCTACQKPLSGGIDTFGSNDMPMCWECHSSAMFDGDPPQMIDAAIFAADAEAGHTPRHCEYCGRFMAKTDYLPDADDFDEELAIECGYSQEQIDNADLTTEGDMSRFRYVTVVWECASCDVWYQFDTKRYYWDPEVGTYTSERPMTLREQAERDRQQQEAAGQLRLL